MDNIIYTEDINELIGLNDQERKELKEWAEDLKAVKVYFYQDKNSLKDVYIIPFDRGDGTPNPPKGKP